MVGEIGAFQIGISFNEDEQKTTITNSDGSVQRFENAVITGSLITMNYRSVDSLSPLKWTV